MHEGGDDQAWVNYCHYEAAACERLARTYAAKSGERAPETCRELTAAAQRWRDRAAGVLCDG